MQVCPDPDMEAVRQLVTLADSVQVLGIDWTYWPQMLADSITMCLAKWYETWAQGCDPVVAADVYRQGPIVWYVTQRTN